MNSTRGVSKYWLIVGLIAVCLLGAFGCGPGLMMPAQRLTTPSPQYATVTFVRATTFGFAVEFNLWDGENFIGVIDAKQYVQVQLPPGEHLFMARGENWSFVNANLEAGKKYVVLANVVPGVRKARVVLAPVTKTQAKWGQGEIDQWFERCAPVTPDQNVAPEWVAKRLPHVREGIELSKHPDTKALVLNPTDDWQY
jgi:hypothetical protein